MSWFLQFSFIWYYFWSTQLFTTHPKLSCPANSQEKKTWSDDHITPLLNELHWLPVEFLNPIQTCRFCLPAFWWYFATLFVFCPSYLPTGSFALIIIWEIIENSMDQPEICWWTLISLCCFCCLELASTFAMFPHSRLSDISSRPTCFIKLFPTHGRSCLWVCFSCFHVRRPEFLDFAPYKNSIIIIIVTTMCRLKDHLGSFSSLTLYTDHYGQKARGGPLVFQVGYHPRKRTFKTHPKHVFFRYENRP